MIVQVIVLIVGLTISTVKAQDTLRINSLKVVDVCSGEKSWLISLSLGTINFSDSLESFDISIGYDRSIIRPSAALKEGTLSAQMTNGPILNVVVPNEMRIYGFNIARSVAGSLPLFAVSGDYLGECNSIGQLTLPIEPDFNGEFKRKFTVRRLDSVTAINVRKNSTFSGCEFDKEEAVISELEASTSVAMKLKNLSRETNAKYRLALSFERQSDSTLVVFDSIFAVGCTIEDIEIASTGAGVTISSLTRDEPEIVAVVKRRSMEASGRVNVSASVIDRTPCGCVQPALNDTVLITIDRPNVNVSTSTDEDACTISLRSNEVHGMCGHSGMKKLILRDLLGQTVQQIETDNYPVVMSTSNLSSGMYFVALSCNEDHAFKLILK